VSISYVYQYLAKRPNLKHEWKSSYDSRKLQLHREQFLTVLKNHPGASLNTIRRIPEMALIGYLGMIGNGCEIRYLQYGALNFNCHVYQRPRLDLAGVFSTININKWVLGS